MNRHHLLLTDEETALLNDIDFAPHRLDLEGQDAAYEANDQAIPALLKSLHERDAIPRARLSYWNDPKYNIDRTKLSHKGIFESNGCAGADIYTHPHFLPFLRYFLFGADLPDAIIEAFEQKVGNPDWVTSGDIVPMGKHARTLAREYNLDRLHAAEEFYKLCLDIGLQQSTGRMVRDAVMRLRRRS